MKKTLCMVVVWITSCSCLDAQRYPDKSVTIEAWEGGADYFSTIAPARMMYRVQSDRKRGFYTYKFNDGRELVVSGHLDRLNGLLEEQVPIAGKS